MAKYGKFIVAILGAIISGVSVFFGFDLEATGITAESIWAMVVPVLTAVGVYAKSNA